MKQQNQVFQGGCGTSTGAEITAEAQLIVLSSMFYVIILVD
jgi:hypothetical protein